MKDQWISVKDRLPRCRRDPDALSTIVLAWPVKLYAYDKAPAVHEVYYGRRATGKPCFYYGGAPLHGITHWQPMPEPPKEVEAVSSIAPATKDKWVVTCAGGCRMEYKTRREARAYMGGWPGCSRRHKVTPPGGKA